MPIEPAQINRTIVIEGRRYALRVDPPELSEQAALELLAASKLIERPERLGRGDQHKVGSIPAPVFVTMSEV